MWTISENLHRAELTEVQRSQQMRRIRDSCRTRSGRRKVVCKLATTRPISKVRAVGGGISAAARDLGMTREEIRRRQTIAALPEATLAAAEYLGLDDSQAALLAAARAEEPEEQIEVLETIAARGSVAAATRPASDVGARALRNLENIAAGELARWIKQTTPNDRPHVIRMLREAADILEDELEAK